MLPEAVIYRQVARQPEVPLVRVLEGHGTSPFSAVCLDESLRLAVGSGRVRPGADGLEIQVATGFSPFARAVGRAVIGMHTAARDALLPEAAHSPSQ